MDPNRRTYLEAAIAQGQTFQRLSMHGDWEYFRLWVERGRAEYERKAHDGNIRNDHIALARALEGYDAINNLLDGFDTAIRNIAKHQQEIDAADRPGTE